MKNTVLVKILKTFSEEEFVRFEMYIKFHACKNSRILKVFINNLKIYYPGFDGYNFTKENLYKSVFGNSSRYNDQIMRNLICRMNKLCKSFLFKANGKFSTDYQEQ